MKDLSTRLRWEVEALDPLRVQEELSALQADRPGHLPVGVVFLVRTVMEVVVHRGTVADLGASTVEVAAFMVAEAAIDNHGAGIGH
jgi:hypothetical protein